MLDLILLTVPLAVIGAGMAWLISYDEMSRHTDRRAAKREATRRALTALVFLLILVTVVAVVVTHANN